MHEVSIAQNIVEVALNALRGHAPARVTAVNIKLGPLSGVDADALRFAFEVVREDTPLAQATLNVGLTTLGLECNACGQTFQPEEYQFACPHCQSSSIRLISGDELEIVDLEVEQS